MRRRLALALMVSAVLIIGLMSAGTAAGYKAKKATDGCTPGYWKVAQHYDSWTGYSPNQKFDTVFEDAFGEMTLKEVLWQGGGGLNALGRHAVAALLNASSPGVAFYWSPAEVIAAFNAVYPGGDYEGMKNAFAFQNEKGCPLN
jgi:hypothetical protein